MELNDWVRMWEEGSTAFHQGETNKVLEAFAEQVFGENIGRAFVPLSGKTLDMVFLAERADEVVGVEIAEQAVQEFFVERAEQPEISAGPPLVYSAAKYRLFVADFFAIETELTGPIDAVFDRAALVALDAETRVRYAHQLAGMLRVGAKILLVTFDYDQAQMAGPPFAVSDDEVQELFGSAFDIERLQKRDVLNDHFRAVGLSSMTESAFALTKL